MDPTRTYEELERIEGVPLDERAAALEELERRLRESLDDSSDE